VAYTSPNVKQSTATPDSNGQGRESQGTPGDKPAFSIWSGLRNARKAISRSKTPPALTRSLSRDSGGSAPDDDDVSMLPLDGTQDLDDISVSDEEEENGKPELRPHMEAQHTNDSIAENRASPVKQYSLLIEIIGQLQRKVCAHLSEDYNIWLFH
jgi:hypothetical protein